MEGYQRIDEWGLIREHIRGPRTVLAPTGRKPKEKLDERLERLLGLIDGRSTVEEDVRGTAWGEFNTYLLLEAAGSQGGALPRADLRQARGARCEAWACSQRPALA